MPPKSLRFFLCCFLVGACQLAPKGIERDYRAARSRIPISVSFGTGLALTAEIPQGKEPKKWTIGYDCSITETGSFDQAQFPFFYEDEHCKFSLTEFAWEDDGVGYSRSSEDWDGAKSALFTPKEQASPKSSIFATLQTNGEDVLIQSGTTLSYSLSEVYEEAAVQKALTSVTLGNASFVGSQASHWKISMLKRDLTQKTLATIALACTEGDGGLKELGAGNYVCGDTPLGNLELMIGTGSLPEDKTERSNFVKQAFETAQACTQDDVLELNEICSMDSFRREENAGTLTSEVQIADEFQTYHVLIRKRESDQQPAAYTILPFNFYESAGFNWKVMEFINDKLKENQIPPARNAINLFFSGLQKGTTTCSQLSGNDCRKNNCAFMTEYYYASGTWEVCVPKCHQFKNKCDQSNCEWNEENSICMPQCKQFQKQTVTDTPWKCQILESLGLCKREGDFCVSTPAKFKNKFYDEPRAN